jgi:hypothetical protein
MHPSTSAFFLALPFFIYTIFIFFLWQDLFRVTIFRSYLFLQKWIIKATTREVVEATPVAMMGAAKLSMVRLPVP